MDIFQFVIAAVVSMSIPSALTQFALRRFEKRLNTRDEEKAAEESKRESAREQSTLLLIQGVGAAIALGEATAHAIRDNKCNGEMTDALKYAQDAKHQQKDFLAQQAVKNLHE